MENPEAASGVKRVGVESYKHRFAKQTLAEWLRSGVKYDDYARLDPVSWRVNRGAPHFGVWEEYPICFGYPNLDGISVCWDESGWNDPYRKLDDKEGPEPALRDLRPPTYAECIGLGRVPSVILDVAIQHKGSIVYGLEVVHRNGISEEKLRRLWKLNIEVYTVSADWVLCQVERPNKLVCERII